MHHPHESKIRPPRQRLLKQSTAEAQQTAPPPPLSPALKASPPSKLLPQLVLSPKCPTVLPARPKVKPAARTARKTPAPPENASFVALQSIIRNCRQKITELEGTAWREYQNANQEATSAELQLADAINGSVERGITLRKQVEELHSAISLFGQKVAKKSDELGSLNRRVLASLETAEKEEQKQKGLEDAITVFTKRIPEAEEAFTGLKKQLLSALDEVQDAERRWTMENKVISTVSAKCALYNGGQAAWYCHLVPSTAYPCSSISLRLRKRSAGLDKESVNDGQHGPQDENEPPLASSSLEIVDGRKYRVEVCGDKDAGKVVAAALAADAESPAQSAAVRFDRVLAAPEASRNPRFLRKIDWSALSLTSQEAIARAEDPVAAVAFDEPHLTPLCQQVQAFIDVALQRGSRQASAVVLVHFDATPEGLNGFSFWGGPPHPSRQIGTLGPCEPLAGLLDLVVRAVFAAAAETGGTVDGAWVACEKGASSEAVAAGEESVPPKKMRRSISFPDLSQQQHGQPWLLSHFTNTVEDGLFAQLGLLPSTLRFEDPLPTEPEVLSSELSVPAEKTPSESPKWSAAPSIPLRPLLSADDVLVAIRSEGKAAKFAHAALCLELKCRGSAVLSVCLAHVAVNDESVDANVTETLDQLAALQNQTMAARTAQSGRRGFTPRPTDVAAATSPVGRFLAWSKRTAGGSTTAAFITTPYPEVETAAVGRLFERVTKIETTRK